MKLKTNPNSASLDVVKTRERFLGLYTDALYDIMDDMGYPNQCLDLKIKALEPRMKIAGPAFTLAGGPEMRTDEEIGDGEYNKHSFFDDLFEGCIIVVAAAQDRIAGHSGELNATAAIARGARGIVVDGGIRDGAQLLDLDDYPVFTRYTSMIEARGRYRNKFHQKPISMTGSLSAQIRVNPGDWIFGDIDGVLVIPLDIVSEVLDRGEKMSAIEDDLREELRKGADVAVVVGKFAKL